ncbi:Squamous cell carcinoma antigen recognized by T-cells 3 [Halotydeus destructor]|nr:Squamous cell carcinoma antigen recognized by T-cells 3 [Halotydeus destructor]
MSDNSESEDNIIVEDNPNGDVGEDDDSSSGDDIEDEESKKKVAELRDTLCTNPFDYDSHVKLISLLREMGELADARAAREDMNKKFPLTPSLWLEWAGDELQVCFTEEEKDLVKNLYERATKDYVSVDVWLDYISFMMGFIESPSGQAETRSVFERALTDGGLHVAKGSLLWDTYLDFEKALIIAMPTDEEKFAQMKKVFELYKRQLSVPLQNIDETYDEFKEWFAEVQPLCSDLTDESMNLIYEKSKKTLEKYKPFEDALLDSDARLQEYLDYLDFAEANTNPAFIQCIYERAIVDNCLDAPLWVKYISFLSKKLKIDYIIKPVCDRAARNCPWSSSIWVLYMIAVENFDGTKEDVMAVLERALVAGLPSPDDFLAVWNQYLDCVRRKTDFTDEKAVESLRKTFNASSDHLISIGGDTCSTVLQYLAKIEAKFCNNIENARKIWNSLLIQHSVYSLSQSWVDCYLLELEHGDNEHAKAILLRGMNSNCDWPETLGNMLLKKEREEGTLETYLHAKEKVDAAMSKLAKKREQNAVKAAKAIDAKSSMKRKEVPENQRKRKADKSVDQLKGGKAEFAFKIPGDAPAKKLKTDESDYGTDDLSYLKPKDMGTDSAKALHTVFVSNLDFSISDDKIKQTFAKFGEIKEVRVVRNYKGLFKGFCYIEYTNIEGARTALKNDRTPIDGRPAFVTEVDKKKEFQYSTSEEKNKLFVKNLSPDVDEEMLGTIFTKFGKIKDIRIVKYRNGHSKGCAFIEFTNADDATSALQADATMVRGKNIEVAISDPQKAASKRTARQEPQNQARILGSGRLDAGGRQRISVPFVPNVVRRKLGSQNSNGKS